MTEKLYLKQHIKSIKASDLLGKVKDLKKEGNRLVQICASKVDGKFEVLYSFDKEHELYNYQLTIPEGQEVESISEVYWHAFIYENEMHDLFGINVKHIALDYGGRFFKVSEPTPWNPKKEERKEDQ